MHLRLLASLFAPGLLAGVATAQVPLYSVSGDPGVLGAAVALDSGFVVVGDPLADVGFQDAGAALVLDAATGNILHTLVASDAGPGQRFAFRVATADGLVLVGAPFDDTQAVDSGAAYLFDAQTGQQLAKFTAPGGGAGDEFGQGLALSGGRAIVGATGADGAGPNTGAAFVFDTATGSFLFPLSAPDGQAFDFFGNAVTAGDGQVLVGARRHDQGGPDAGSTYLFDLGTGAFVAELRPDDSQAGQNFGAALAMDAEHIVVGAIQDQSLAGVQGAAYVFDRATGLPLHKLAPDGGAPNALFGQGLDLWQGRALIGASHQSTNDGFVYLFDVVSGNQLMQYRSTATAGALYGVSLGFEEDRAVVGAPGHAATGAAYAFLPELPIGTMGCPGVPNSTGVAADLAVAGSSQAGDNAIWLVASNLPAGQFGFFVTGQTSGLVVGPGGSQGNLCITGTLARFNAMISNSGAAGFFQLRVDTTQIPTQPMVAIQPGETWHYQAWYRDSNPQPTSNFSASVVVTYQ